MVFTTKFTKQKGKRPPPMVRKFAEGGRVPYPRTDPRKTPPDDVPLPEDDPRTEYRQARRDLRSTPPVTVLEDVVGRFSESKGQSNALRDAIRERAIGKIRESGYEKKD